MTAMTWVTARTERPPGPGWRACIRRPDGTADIRPDPVLLMQHHEGSSPAEFRVLVAVVTGDGELTVLPGAEILQPGQEPS